MACLVLHLFDRSLFCSNPCRQRAAEGKAAARDNAIADVIKALLPFLDSFEAAVESHDRSVAAGAAPGTPQEDLIHAAYRALRLQALEVLKREGVELVGGEEVGQQFDPERHEALMRQPAGAGVEDGEVVSVLRQGYMVKGKLVRPALVVVAFDE